MSGVHLACRKLGVVAQVTGRQLMSPLKDVSVTPAPSAPPSSPRPVTPTTSDPTVTPTTAAKVYVSHSDVEKKRKQKISDGIQKLAITLQLQDQIGKLVC